MDRLGNADEKELSLHQEHPRHVIPEVCQQFHSMGWMLGTGGAISVKFGNDVYITPTGVQKEKIKGEDLFQIDMNGEVIRGPPESKKLGKSSCTPVFMEPYRRRNAGSVMHIHSKNAVMISLLYPGSHFEISHHQMIKGIKNAVTGKRYKYDDTLRIPIIDNAAEEHQLQEPLAKAIEDNPETCVVLVRRHGIYVWGDDWKEVKTMCECLDYLFDIVRQMKLHGLDTTPK
ncbi:APIP (predicted) [Pycnogonum litorale]